MTRCHIRWRAGSRSRLGPWSTIAFACAVLLAGAVPFGSEPVSAAPVAGDPSESPQQRLERMEAFFEWLKNFGSTSPRVKVPPRWAAVPLAIPLVTVHLPGSGARIVEQSGSKVVIEIDTRDSPLHVTLETFAAPRRARITGSGALAVPNSSLTVLDKYFSRIDQEQLVSSSLYGAQGLGAWLGRPAYNKFSAWNGDAVAWRLANPGGSPTSEQIRQFSRVTHVTTSNTVALKSGRKYRLLRGSITGSVAAFADGQAVAWRVINTVRLADGLSPACRFDNGSACGFLGIRSRPTPVPLFLIAG